MNDKDICRLCLTTCSISTNIFIEDWVNKIKDSLNVEVSKNRISLMDGIN